MTRESPGTGAPAHPAGPRRVPLGTYRLQLNADFTFAQARDVLDYLARLGVSDCYTSPYFRARPGSAHGYDVADHNSINPELGGAAGFARFVEALDALGMGHVLDFVPNHMGIDARGNAWWRDVLENGSCSPWAPFFARARPFACASTTPTASTIRRATSTWCRRWRGAPGTRPARASTTSGRRTWWSRRSSPLTEVVACFPVYRTYVTEAGWTPRDREIIEEAVARARRRNPALEPSVFAFLRDVLRARRRDPALFLSGAYTPLETETVPGTGAIAFARQHGDRAVLFVAPRLWSAVATAERPFPLDAKSWKISRVLLPPALAERSFRNLLTGERLEPVRKQDEAWLFLARVFATLPVAMLEAEK